MQNLSRAYCEDESKKLMHITEIFLEEWRRLDLGANIVAEYIHTRDQGKLTRDIMDSGDYGWRPITTNRCEL